MTANVDLKAFRNAIAHDDGNLVLNDKNNALVKQNRGTGTLSKYTVYIFEQTKGNADKNAEVRNALYDAIKATHDEKVCSDLMDRIKSRLGLVDGDENAGKRTEFLKRGEVRAIIAEVDRWDAEKERIKNVVDDIVNWKLPDPAKKGGSLEEVLLSGNATDTDKNMQFVLSEVMNEVAKMVKTDGYVFSKTIDMFITRSKDAAEIRSGLTKTIQYACLKQIVDDYNKNGITELIVGDVGVSAENKYRDKCIAFLRKEIGRAADIYAKALNAIDCRLAPYANLISNCDAKIEALSSRPESKAMPRVVAQLDFIRRQVFATAVEALQGKHIDPFSESRAISTKSVCALAFAETNPAAAENERTLHDNVLGARLKLLNKGLKILDEVCSGGCANDDEVMDKFMRGLRDNEIVNGINKALSADGPKGFRDNLRYFNIANDKLGDYLFDETKSIFGKDGTFAEGGVVNIIGMNDRASGADVALCCDNLNCRLSGLRKLEELEPKTDEQLKQIERDARVKFNDSKEVQGAIDKALKIGLRPLAYRQAKKQLNIADVHNLPLDKLFALDDKDVDVYGGMCKKYDGIDSETKAFFDRITTKMPKRPAEDASPDTKELWKLRTAICTMYEESQLFGGEGLKRIIDNAANSASLENRKRFVLTGVNPLDTVEGQIAMCKQLLFSGSNASSFSKLCTRAKVYAGLAAKPEIKAVFDAMGTAVADMEEGKLPKSNANWVNDLKAKFTFDKLPALKEAFEKYGSFSPSEEHLKDWCDKMIAQIKEDFAERRYSLSDRIAQLDIKDHIDIVEGKELPKEVREFVDGTYLKELVDKAIEGITDGAKRFLEGMDRLERKIQQVNPNPDEFFAGKADENGGAVKFTLKTLSEALDMKKEFAIDRGLPKLVSELVRQLRADGPLLNPFRDMPEDGEKLWKEFDGQIADFVRNANLATFAKRDEIKDYNLFAPGNGGEVDNNALVGYANKIIQVRLKVFEILNAPFANQDVGKTYDATDANYSLFVLRKSLHLPNFTGQVTVDKGFLTNIGNAPVSDSERVAKLAERKKIVDMNLLLEKATVRKLTAMAEKATSILLFKSATATVAEELTKGMTDAVNGYEKAFKKVIRDKIDERFLNDNAGFLENDKWINALIKERAVQEAERFLVQGDDYRLDEAALAREAEKAIRMLIMMTVTDVKDNRPFSSLGKVLAAPGNKATLVQGVDVLRQNSLKAFMTFGPHLPSTEDLWAEYVQAGPFAEYSETDKKTGRVVISEAKMSAMLKSLQKNKGDLVLCVNEDFKNFAKLRIDQCAKAVQRYEADCKAALANKSQTGLLDRFGLPSTFPVNLPHDILIKGYLAGVPKSGKGVDNVAQLQTQILGTEAGRGLVEACIKRIKDQLALPESRKMAQDGWTVKSGNFFSSTTTTYTGLNKCRETIKQKLGIDFNPQPIFDKIVERTVRTVVQDPKAEKPDLSVSGVLLKALAELDMYLDLVIDNLKPVKEQAEGEKSFASVKKDDLAKAVQGVLTEEMKRVANNLDLEHRTVKNLPNDIRNAVRKILFHKVNNQGKA